MRQWVWWVLVAAAGAAVLATSTFHARRPSIGPREQRWFRRINRLPGWLYAVLWLPMQLGNLVVGMLAGVGVAVWARDLALGVASVTAAALKLLIERVIRTRMADWLSVRQRPGTSEPGAIVRGRDVPAKGPSFPSGHVILAWAVACVATTALPWPVDALPFLLAAGVGIGRIYVGAHNPLDVTAGLGAGLIVGGGLAALLTL